jgi:hypothetical protein
MTKTEQIQTNDTVAKALREHIKTNKDLLTKAFYEKDDFKVSAIKKHITSLKSKLRKIENENSRIAQLSL